MAAKQQFKVTCYDGGKKLFEYMAPRGCDPKKLLERLICRDLSPEEVINASRRPNNKKYWDPFVLTGYEVGFTMAGGHNPHYTIRLMED
jgi:hypothetical protein